ncbi:helix-turn-helix domain-containing protein [Flavobacterium hungaricum]|uniref:XRE family transcriptional regulator n=1 Tax=Flavobacterium hungaricum TaxID=2082725 RepID=A0ABR9TSA9_9FLAO|nr:XRE family transcriptional regulator [Flavobacterium hungaricum]
MNETDLKIFELIKLLQSLGTIKYEYDFADSVGILKQTLTKIKMGTAHFRTEHIKRICEVFNVNANWIFGLENKVFNSLKTQKNKEFQEQ